MGGSRVVPGLDSGRAKSATPAQHSAPCPIYNLGTASSGGRMIMAEIRNWGSAWSTELDSVSAGGLAPRPDHQIYDNKSQHPW